MKPISRRAAIELLGAAPAAAALVWTDVEARQAHQNVLDLAQAMRTEIANLEEQRESLRKRLDRGESFLNKFLSSGDPADMKASLNDVEARLKHQETKLEETGPQIEAARQKLEFFTKDYKGKLGDFLNDPENAKRLFDQTSVAANGGQISWQVGRD